MSIETVPDVIRFILEHRATGTIPDGFRAETDPGRPDWDHRRQRPAGPKYRQTEEEQAAAQAELNAWLADRKAYEAAYQAWNDWHSRGGIFTGWNGEHRYPSKVHPSDLYPVIQFLLGVSASKARSMTSEAFHAGEIVRTGGGSQIAYTLPDIVEAQAKAAQDLDVELRALAAHAESLGIKVGTETRGGLVRSIDVASTVAEVVALIEAERDDATYEIRDAAERNEL